MSTTRRWTKKASPAGVHDGGAEDVAGATLHVLHHGRQGGASTKDAADDAAATVPEPVGFGLWLGFQGSPSSVAFQLEAQFQEERASLLTNTDTAVYLTQFVTSACVLLRGMLLGVGEGQAQGMQEPLWHRWVGHVKATCTCGGAGLRNWMRRGRGWSCEACP